MFHSVKIHYLLREEYVEGGSERGCDERHEAQHGSADPDVLGGGAHPGPVLRPRHPPQPLHRPRPRHGGQGR